ncbi:MAG: rhodanese-like domain-containing protein [Methanosarcinaceae archaeon]|jgi:rhodanese-related sulfurtransferase|nr:rhodanese-like domain-containing protein [Methanosarcinaceae archaeon]
MKNQIIENITPKEAFNLIQLNKDDLNFIIIDLRTPNDFSNGHIENSINIDYRSTSFKDEVNKLDLKKKYLIYCRSGRCSAATLNIMKLPKFIEVYNMLGGITQWNLEGFPIVK